MRSWFRYSLLATVIFVVTILWIMFYTDWGLRMSLRVANQFIPGELEIGETRGTLAGPLNLQRIRYRHARFSLDVDTLELSWQPLALLNGTLVLEDLKLSQVSIGVHPADTATEKAGASSFVLPLVIEVRQAQADTIQIQRDEQAPVHVEHILLSGRARENSVTLQTLRIDGYHARLTAAGEISLAEHVPMQLDIAFRYQPDDRESLQGKGALVGDLRELRLVQQLSGLGTGELSLSATDVRDALHWQGELDLQAFEVNKLDPGLPQVAVQGKMKAQGDLAVLQVQGDLDLHSSEYGFARLVLEGESDVQFDKYRFGARGDVTGLDVPPASYTISAQGNRAGLSLNNLSMQALDGEVSGSASIGWTPHMRVDADLALRNIDTAKLTRDWPGNLSARLKIDSRMVDESLRIGFDLNALKGTLRDYPLTGNARGDWQQARLKIDALTLNIADSQLTAQGQVNTQWQMQVKLKSDDLRELLPGVKGRVELSGQVSGSRAEPGLELQGRAAQLEYADNHIEQLTLNAELGLAEQDPLRINVQAQGVQTRAGEWQQVSLQSHGVTSAHNITLDIGNAQDSLHTSLRGAFTRTWRWAGHVQDFELKLAPIGHWQLRAPATLEISPQTLRVSTLCMQQQTAYLCADVDWQAAQYYVQLDGQAVPLNLLNPWLADHFQLAGMIDLQGKLSGTQTGAATGSMVISSAERAVHVDFAEVGERISFGATNLRLDLDAQGLRGRLDLPLAEGGGMQAQLVLADWQPQLAAYHSQPVQAELTLNKLPAEVITRFIPDMVQTRGELQAAFSLGGTLSQPELTGQANWQNGRMLIPEAGITVEDISAEFTSARANRINFTLTARSGEGEARLEGKTQLDPAQGWPTQARLTSTRFEIFNIPEAYILINSDVSIAIVGNRIDLDGVVNVPRARLRPRELPEGTPTVSNDVVIVAGDEVVAEPTPWRVTTRIRVELGELVDFDGFGVSGKLQGNLLIIDEPGRPVIGQGELRISEGVYRLRGQDLNIRKGRLIFANSFIDNPGIDVEAIRELEQVLVGVRLKGTLRQPQLSVFSEPAMSETEALTYLILGHGYAQSTGEESETVRNTAAAMGFLAGDMLAREIGGSLGLDELRVDVGETAQKTSLVVGKYLSSKLYVRYFTGIVESSNIVQLRYQLSDRIQIQTEGGYRGSQSVTGGDIFFTIRY